ncbi:MAG: tRNA (adenosine(37)-N6)-threonylcarbamoyltransferase complex ATPase subunit type 1 TsaE [Flavobacteriaceae bacterium]
MDCHFKTTDLENLSTRLIQDFSSKIIRIDGPMGAGKTTLISSLCNALGVRETVSSPTFSLVNTYRSSTGLIYHFDFYRLDHPNEALDFGLEEYLESGHLCFLEWAEKITPHLPLHYDHYNLSHINKNTRRIVSITKIS